MHISPLPEMPANYGNDRRSHVRQAFDWSAKLRSSRGILDCQIRNFSPTGMFLAWVDDNATKNFAKGDLIVVSFETPQQQGARVYEISATVVWQSYKGIGVYSQDITSDILQALQWLASRAITNGSSADKAKPQHNLNTRAILEDCRKLVSEHIQELLTKFLSATEEAFFKLANEAKNNSEQRQFFDAQLVIKQHKERLPGEILHSVQQRVMEMDKPVADIKVMGEKTLHGLSLMEKDELEDLLAIARIVSKVEPRNKEVLFELEQRFSHLFGITINKGNLAVGAAVLCNIFAEHIRPLSFNGEQTKIIYGILEEHLLPKLKALYPELNDVLKKHQVLPTLDYRPQGVAQSPAMARAVVPSMAPTEPGTPAPQLPPESLPEMAQPMPGMTAQRYFRPPPIIPPSPFSQVLPPQLHSPPAPHPDPGFQAAQTLRMLQQMLQSTRAIAGMVHPQEMTLYADNQSPTTAGVYNKVELINALAAMQQQGGAEADYQQGFKEQLVSVLSQNGQQSKRIDERDYAAIDMASHLLQSINADPGLNNTAKLQLNRLQMPIFQAAIADPAFLGVSNHPARQLIDHITKLQSLPNKDGLAAEQRLRLQGLVERIASEYQTNPAIFTDALGEVNALVEEQKRVYAENVRKLMQECEEQQAFLHERQKQGGDKANRPLESTQRLSREAMLWLDRAKRLQVGDIVLLDHSNTGILQRLGLAWIGENYHPYVFVDVLGNKAASLTLKELMMHLRRGTAIIAGTSTELSVVDKAMQSVVQRMHSQVAERVGHDSQTGLMNRKAFIGQLEQALWQVAQEDINQVVAYFRLNGVETVAEKYGIATADNLLKRVAKMFADVLIKRGNLARVADLDFCILIKNSTQLEGKRLVQGLHSMLEKLQFRIKDESLSLKVKAIAIPITADSSDAESFLNEITATIDDPQFDKAQGNDDLEGTLFRTQIESSGVMLSRILAERQITLYRYRVEGLDANAQLPNHIILVPGIRDDNGGVFKQSNYNAPKYQEQIEEVDRRYLQASLQWLERHPEMLMQEDVNMYMLTLSIHSLANISIIDYLLTLLSRSSVPPSRLCFEIPETITVACFENAQRLLRTLQEFGCRFSLSGFGRTTAKHDYLHNLPVDFLKIDETFVKDILSSSSDYAMVKSSHEIGHLLNKKTIAEGVDSEPLLEQLKTIGVDYVQGSLVEKPQLLDTVEL